MKKTISGIVLVGGNISESLLKRALSSLNWCDEIIKIDTTKIQGSFSAWRNQGLKRAKGDWIFYLDSDEEVTVKLKQEIIQKISLEVTPSCYALPRKNIIFGKEFKFGGQWPDYQKRLFKKVSLKKWEGLLHEQPVVLGSLEYINNPIIHHKDITISQMLDKTNEWSMLEAKLLFDSNHPKMNALRFLSVFLREFYLRFIKQLSFMDGTKGTIYGIYQIYSRLITYSKLWEMQIKK